MGVIVEYYIKFFSDTISFTKRHTITFNQTTRLIFVFLHSDDNSSS
jgi:hypothetical protein